MNRAMYSGVAGLKTHMTRMDVIGNNISNVNTYGFKSQRAVFSDIFYQTLTAASGGTGNRGGVNPSSVGYGAMLAGIQSQMTQSSMQNTGFGLDVAITGEGFLQVMDADGNIFYTKAGLLDYDSNGYLTDINGNFVLGTADKDGTPSSQKIKLDNLGSVDPRVATITESINEVDFTIQTTNPTKYGNVGFTINSSNQLPQGLDASATITSTGSINVTLNASTKFNSIDEVNNAINNAILEANNGVAHTAGRFVITASKDVFAEGPLTGAEVTGATFGTKTGRIDGIESGAFGGGLTFVKASTGFTGEGDVDALTATYDDTGDGSWEIKMTIGGKNYSCKITPDSTAPSLLLRNSTDDYIQVTNPGFDQMTTLFKKMNGGADPAAGSEINAFAETDSTGAVKFNPGDLTATKSVPSRELGLSSVTFTLANGTEGGVITLDQLSGIAIASDGTVMVSHAELGTVSAGKISLANFANPYGLQYEGNNYYSQTANSGEPQLADPGSEGTGALKASALEMSNVDLSNEMADMITTQRGFQANSRVITVSDTMLEELINLKR